jgi:hypothetical protein
MLKINILFYMIERAPPVGPGDYRLQAWGKITKTSTKSFVAISSGKYAFQAPNGSSSATP